MITEGIGLAIAGLGALVYSLRAWVGGREVPGRMAHTLARVGGGGGLLAGGISLTVGTTALATGWVWGAVAIAYGSIVIEILQIIEASRRRRLSEGARLRRYVSQSRSHGFEG